MKDADWPQFSKLNIFGLWPGEGALGKAKRFLGLFIMFLVTPVYLCAGIEQVREHFLAGDVMDALTVLNEFASAGQCYLNTITFILYRSKIIRTVSLIDKLNEDILGSLGGEYKKELEKRKKSGLKAYNIFITSYALLLLAWAFPPMLSFLFLGQRTYPLHILLPHNKEYVLGYLGNYLFQITVTWSYCMGFCMFGALFIAIGEWILGHLNLLQRRLEAVRCSNRSPFNELVKCIDYQTKILQICREFQSFTTLPLIANCLFTVLVLCILLVNFTMADSNVVLRVINLLTEGQIHLMFLGTFCWYCNEITNQSSQILRAAYFCDWYNGSQPEKKLVLNIMMRSMKPIYFGGFLRIDMNTFIDVFKGAFSYYNFISAVK